MSTIKESKVSVGTVEVEQINQKNDKRNKIKVQNNELKLNLNNNNAADEIKYEGSYRRESGQFEG